jgi:hypothetical protein
MRCETTADWAAFVANYNCGQDEVYEEIVDRCQDFEADIERELADNAEPDENGEHPTRIKNGLVKVQGCEVLSAEGSANVVEVVALCEAALEGIAAHVYKAEG